MEGELRIGYIYDFISAEQGVINRALLCKGLSHLLSEKVDFVKCGIAGNASLHRQLAEMKFQQSREDGGVVYEVLSDQIDQDRLIDLNNWYVTLAETDWLGW